MDEENICADIFIAKWISIAFLCRVFYAWLRFREIADFYNGSSQSNTGQGEAIMDRSVTEQNKERGLKKDSKSTLIFVKDTV